MASLCFPVHEIEANLTPLAALKEASFIQQLYKLPPPSSLPVVDRKVERQITRQNPLPPRIWFSVWSYSILAKNESNFALQHWRSSMRVKSCWATRLSSTPDDFAFAPSAAARRSFCDDNGKSLTFSHAYLKSVWFSPLKGKWQNVLPQFSLGSCLVYKFANGLHCLRVSLNNDLTCIVHSNLSSRDDDGVIEGSTLQKGCYDNEPKFANLIRFEEQTEFERQNKRSCNASQNAGRVDRMQKSKWFMN